VCRPGRLVPKRGIVKENKTCSRLVLLLFYLSLCLAIGPMATAADAHLKTVASAPGIETILGSGDTITLATPDIEELDKRVLTVNADGFLDVPLVGHIQAAGLSTQELAGQVQQSLKRLYLNPEVTISAVDVKSRPVSVFGSVNTPGVQQADGHRRLLEVLSIAGGLRQDAGPRIELTRLREMGELPAALGAKTADRFETADIAVSDLLEGRMPDDNVVVKAGDVITIPKARLVYVIGDVKKAGGFVVGEHDNLTVLKALALAEGLQSTANSSHAKIMRAGGPQSPEDERPFNVKKLLAGQLRDMPLRPDDVLFIPSSLPKKVAVRVMEAAIQTGTGIAIWH